MRIQSEKRPSDDVTIGGVTLSPRQMDVLRMAAAGMGTPKIARRLGISTFKVKDHRKTIKRKFSLSEGAGVPEMIAAAKRIGFLSKD